MEEQRRLAEERERERKAREEKMQTVDLDSQRVDMYAYSIIYIAKQNKSVRDWNYLCALCRSLDVLFCLVNCYAIWMEDEIV